MRVLRLVPCALFFAAAMAGCRDATGPAGAFDGQYRLRAVDGRRLPAPAAFGGKVLGGTLDATALDSLRVRVWSTEPGGQTAYDREDAFAYRRVSDSLVVAGPIGVGGRVERAGVRVRLAFRGAYHLGFPLYWYDLTFRR